MSFYPEPVMFNESNKKITIIELVIKIIFGFVVAGLLTAILIIVILRFPTNNGISSQTQQQQQETLMKLLIKSNEYLAEVQREHEMKLEKARQLSEQAAQKNLTDVFVERLKQIEIEKQEKERANLWEIEQYRVYMAAKYRSEDQERQNEKDFYEFLEKSDLENTLPEVFEEKVFSLLSHFDIQQKSILIKMLYKKNLLHSNCNNNITSPCRLKLDDADLSGIQLGTTDQLLCPNYKYDYIHLPHTNLTNATFDCSSLINANFFGSNLSDASFVRSHLYNTTLSFVDLTKCNFQGAKMDGTFLWESSAIGAQFQQASLVETQMLMIKANWSDFREANLSKSRLIECQLMGANFDYTIINEAYLSDVYLANTTFYRVSGYKTEFWTTDLTNTTFREGTLVHSQFITVEGNNTDFSHTTLNGSLFNYAHLNNASFYNATMNNVSLYIARILDSNFRNASLMNVNFYLANLTGSDFSEANLDQSVQLTDEQLDTVFSISNAILPNGTIGKNKNLLKYSHPLCDNSTMIMNTSEWITSSPVSIKMMNESCVFQSTISNITTISQIVDISRYVKRMIDAGSTNILIETKVISGTVDANLYLYNSTHHFIDQRFNIFNNTTDTFLSVKQPIIDPMITYAELEILFLTANTTIDNIHLSIEV